MNKTMFNKKLKEFGLNIRESDNPERLPIDFAVEDEDDNIAWVWGHNLDDVQVECNHALVAYGDGEGVGTCVICGDRCDWHYEYDDCSVEDHHWESKECVPHQWHKAETPGGFIGEYLKRLEVKNDKA